MDNKRDRLESTLSSLRVPEQPRDGSESFDVAEWNRNAQESLRLLHEELRLGSTLSVDDLARIVVASVPLTGDFIWLKKRTKKIATDILSCLDVDDELVQKVLRDHVRPVFLSSPPPRINLETGRALPRIAGGALAAQDQYEEQNWKRHASIGDIIAWCIRHVSKDGYETLWHLLIPPVMTFLDDYQAIYKLQGVDLVCLMLNNVPPSLLKRTGIGKLLLSSSSAALAHLHDDASPQLIRKVVHMTLRLIDILTEPNSVERFDGLCHLLGENIVGGIWIYATNEPAVMEASISVLTDIVHALGIGTTRYLKALVPQCAHLIAPSEFQKTNITMQLSASDALNTIIIECKPRIHRWRGAIIEGLGKCWIALHDVKVYNQEQQALREHVRENFRTLASACPSVLKDEYTQLTAANPSIFGPVFSSLESPYISPHRRINSHKPSYGVESRHP